MWSCGLLKMMPEPAAFKGLSPAPAAWAEWKNDVFVIDVLHAKELRHAWLRLCHLRARHEIGDANSEFLLDNLVS
jgi:hypothetical protein